jgi:hypothetical protein
MLDSIGFVAGFAGIAINLVAILSVLRLSLGQRIFAAGLVGAWIGLSGALASAGLLSSETGPPIPLVGVMFGLPLLAFAAVWAGSRSFREAVTGIPAPLLIGLNMIRSLGFLFLMLATVGRLGGPFPYSAGWGDVITGTLALPVALIAARTQRADGLVAAWNLFGTMDLVAAVFLGVTSANGSAIQLIFAGAGSEAMQHMPWNLVPTALVPFYLITHWVIAAQLVQRKRLAVAA